jgi:hypothetical protein
MGHFPVAFLFGIIFFRIKGLQFELHLLFFSLKNMLGVPQFLSQLFKKSD